MSRTSPAYRILVPLLAGAQAVLLACAGYVLVADDLQILRPAEPVAEAPFELPAVGGMDWSSMDVPSSPLDEERVQELDEQRVQKRTTRKQRPVVQARTAVPPDPKKAALSWPVGGRVTSPFGERPRPENRDVREFHHGLDIGCGTGWPIRAANGGQVVAIGKAKGYGNAILLDHRNGYMTLYAHLSEFSVEYQDQVVRGQVIGACGESGRATGPHLHFEVRYGGYVWDPLTFLP